MPKNQTTHRSGSSRFRRMLFSGMSFLFGAPMLLGATSAFAADDKPVTLGLLVALTGDFSIFGTNVQVGADLAASEIQAAGGKIRLVYQDDRCLPKNAVTGYKELTAVEHADLIIGSGCTGNIIAVGPLAEREKMPVIALLDTNDETKKAGKTTFVVGFDAAELAATVAEEILRQGYHRVGIFYEADAWAQYVSDHFKATFEKEKRGTVTAVTIQQGADPDVRPNLLKLAASKPDALFLVPAYNGGNVLKQIRAMGLKFPLFGPDTLANQSALDIAGKDAEGVIYANVVLDEAGSAMKTFQDKLQKKNGKLPDTIFYAALGYDTVRLAYRALQSGKPAVDALATMECSDCVNPMKRFDGERLAKIRPTLLEIRGGRTVKK